MTKTDEELIPLAQNGDENALNELLQKYKSLVSKIARSYFLVGGDSEDLIQEGMIGLYKAIKNFKCQKNATFKTFAGVCIKNQIQSAVRIASSDKNKALTGAVSLAYDSPDDEDEDDGEIIIPSPLPSPEKQIEEKESIILTLQEINKRLSPLEKTVLKLYLKGYSYAEISSHSGLNKKSVDNALSRIKNKLSFLKNIDEGE